MAWDKVQIRREKAARLECMGWPDRDIASAIGLTPAGLAQMKMTPEYQDILVSVKTGVLRELDAEMGSDTKALMEKVREHIPQAIQTLIDAVSQRNDPKLAVAAANDLIAMDGRLAKVSRVGAATSDQGGAVVQVEDNEIVRAILASMPKKQEAEPSISDPPASPKVN